MVMGVFASPFGMVLAVIMDEKGEYEGEGMKGKRRSFKWKITNSRIKLIITP